MGRTTSTRTGVAELATALGICVPLLLSGFFVAPGSAETRPAERAERPDPRLQFGASDPSAVLISDVLTEPRLLHDEVAAGLTLPAELVGARGRALAKVVADRDAARAQWSVLAQVRIELLLREAQLQDRLYGLTRQELSAQSDTARAELALRAYAVSAFTTFGSDVRPEAPFGNPVDRTKQLNGEAGGVFVDTVDRTRAALAEVRREVALVSTELEVTQQERREVTEARDEALAAAEAAESSRKAAQRRFEWSLMLMELPETSHLTVVAVNAYYNAQLRTEARDPGCGVQWWQLAGIGRVESIHGFFGASRVTATGQTTEAILGPVLDGTKFLAIPDSDGGALDGDIEWDRAVGPMQFIPGSWAAYGVDGNRDRKVDPHNLYDATLAAARHLCGSNRNLLEPLNYTSALLGYNRSVEYGRTVAEFSEKYRSLLPELSPLPTEEEQIVGQPDPS